MRLAAFTVEGAATEIDAAGVIRPPGLHRVIIDGGRERERRREYKRERDGKKRKKRSEGKKRGGKT